MSARCRPLPILQGERCLLRALVPEDAPALVAHADDPAVARNLFDGFPQPYTLAAATAWAGHEAQLGRVRPGLGDRRRRRRWSAASACAQDAGWLRCNAEIGYWIGQAFWRRGIASDAVRQVTDWAFAARARDHAHPRADLRRQRGLAGGRAQVRLRARGACCRRARSRTAR